jgi:hypothetical protein
LLLIKDEVHRVELPGTAATVMGLIDNCLTVAAEDGALSVLLFE